MNKGIELMERNLEYIRSKLIDGDLISTEYNRLLTLKRNDQALLRFCMDELTDDETADLCNFISLAADLIEDRFSFSCYDDYYCYEVIFDENAKDSSYLGIYVEEFPNRVTLVYHSYLDLAKMTSFTRHFRFTNLEDAEQIINEFMHQIYQSKENSL